VNELKQSADTTRVVSQVYNHIISVSFHIKHDLFEVPGLPVWGNVKTLDNIMYLKIAVGPVKPVQHVAAVDRNCGVLRRTFLVEQGLYSCCRLTGSKGLMNALEGTSCMCVV
jgi:hypothetical protein